MLLTSIEPALLSWSRAQFALTACYHWIFVPLTLGLAVIMATMETLYVVKKDEFWKRAAQFWMKIFGINFAIGVATGIILEFEFGTNWSNYSWFVGDIFGAPLAIEGIVAFFMEATFIAVMFFGWGKVGKGFHLASTWLTGIGATLSAWWILVANSWMQHPVGMEFNPVTVRNEMMDFFTVAFSPVAVTKFFHSVMSGWTTAAVVVIGISAWYLLKRREQKFATKSMTVAVIIGLIGTLAVLATGDKSAIHMAEYQPMKLAAAEGLTNGTEEGQTGAPFSIVPGLEIPNMLSLLATHDPEGFVPGTNDILYKGYVSYQGDTVPAATEKMERGKAALAAFRAFREAEAQGDSEGAALARAALEENNNYFGYGYVEKVEDLVPPVIFVYWPFRIMVGGGMVILLMLIVTAWFLRKPEQLSAKKWLLYIAIWCIPLAYLTGQCGWITAEIGRQPWAIQDLLPVNAAISNLSAATVKTTFFIFLIIFTILLTAEIRILCRAIKKGPQL